MPQFSPLQLIQHKDVHDKNNIRIKEQEWQYRYYSGDFYNTKKFLASALAITYSAEDIPEMQLQVVNITEKIINQMCVVYSDPAQRQIMIDGKANDELTKYYNEKMPLDINTADKDSHRLAKLHNTVIPHVTFEDGRFKYTTLPSYLYDVKQDAKKLLEVSYEKMYGDEWYAVYWTDTQHYRMDALGNRSAVPGGNGKNPFGVIPFPVFRLKNCVDFWGEGQNDLINVNEQVNVLLTKLINSDVIQGTEGTVLAINLDLNKAGEEEDGVKKVRTGRRHPITVEGAKVDDQQPSLQHITGDPHITDTERAIDWYIRLIANFKGLNPNVVLGQVKDTSDYQKIMDAVEQMEIRKGDIESCRVFEEERFQITKKMNNVLVGTEDNLMEIPEEAELVVDFAEIEVQKTRQELRDDRDWKLNKNLTTLVDIMIEDNPDLTIGEAKRRIEDNKKANKELIEEKKAFVNNLNNNPNEENNA